MVVSITRMKNISIFECMRFIVKILDFLVASNIYVSLGVYALTWLSLQIYNSENTALTLFVFFSTLFAYNFMRLVRVHPMLLEGESTRHQSIYKLRVILWAICLFSGLISCYFFIEIYQSIFRLLIALTVVSLAYALPIYKKGDKWLRLRDVPGVKIFLIAIVWSLVTEGFPALLSEGSLSVLPLVERFLFVFAITIPFDIRDLRFDDYDLATIPQYFGVRKARWLGVGALLVAELILAYRFFFRNEFNLLGALAIYLTYEFSAFLVYKSHPQLKERFVTLGVEGMSILMGLLFYLSQIL
jgi:hypothetical protein